MGALEVLWVYCIPWPFAFLLSGLLFAGLCGAAFAAGPHDRTQFGHDISVGTDEEAAGVTCYKRGSRAHRG